MSNVFGKNALGTDDFIQASGTGLDADPHLPFSDSFSTQIKSAFFTGSASGDVVPLVALKKIRVLSLVITASAACTVKLQSGGATDLTPPFHLAANGNLSISNPLGLTETAAGAKLNAVLASAATYSVFVTYREV